MGVIREVLGISPWAERGNPIMNPTSGLLENEQEEDPSMPDSGK